MPLVCAHEMGHTLRFQQADGSIVEMASCVHCGTTQKQAEAGKGCISRRVAAPVPDGVRWPAADDPEVTRRLRALREMRHNVCYSKKRPPGENPADVLVLYTRTGNLTLQMPRESGRRIRQ